MKIFEFFRGRESRLALLCEKVARACFFIAITAIPLICLPWTSEPLEINKQFLLILCAILSLLAFTGYCLARRELTLKKTLIYLVAKALIVFGLLSSVFSLWHYSSVFGASGQEYACLITLASLIILFTVGITVLKHNDLKKIFIAIIIPGAVILLFEALSALGVNFFEQGFIGAPNALGVYSCVILSMSLSLVYFGKQLMRDAFYGATGVIVRICAIVSIPLSLLILYALDYWLLWAFVVLTICALFISSFFGRTSMVYGKKLALSTGLLIVSCVFIFIPTPGGLGYAPEIAPTYESSKSIAKQALSDNSVIFGSGPGTYEIDFIKYKPEALNNSLLWDTIFNRSSSHLLTTLTTNGFAYVIAYLILISCLLYLGFKQLSKTDKNDFGIALSLFVSWTVLAFAQIFYSSNMTLQTMFWLLSACVITNASDRTWRFGLEKTPTQSFFSVLISVILVIVALVAGFLATGRYASDIAYAKAIANTQAGGSIDRTIDELIFASTVNRWNDVYARNLSYAFLYKSAQMLADSSVSPDDVIVYIGLSSDWAKRAIELAPNNVANYAMLGDVYREITPFVSGSYDYAIASYKKAIELAPTNPKYLVSLGRAYLAQADAFGVVIAGDDQTLAQESKILRDSALTGGIDAFNQALTLKNDYAVAQYYLALAYERQGNLSEAIARIASLQEQSPYDANLALQLGFLYLQQGKLEDARVALEYVIGLSSDYSNARWFLSSVLEQQGDIEGAIEQVEKVLELNPDNGLIKERLNSLKAGLVVEEVLEPLLNE